MEKLAKISLVRHQILHNPRSTASQNDGFDDEKYVTPLITQAYYYVAEINIGMPSQKVFLVVDTIAGLIWTQCEPCTFGFWGCHPQEAPLFDPKKSASYARLSCTDRLCPINKGNMDNKFFKYSFTFTNDTKDTVDLGLVFGCSTYTHNLPIFINKYNKITGILGLNFSPLSLYKQLFYKIGGKFSYCIASLEDPLGAFQTHNLRFGDQVKIPSKPIPTTQYIVLADSDVCFLDVVDISVGPIRLMLPEGMFDAAKGRGMILDPASPLTVLRLDVYLLLIAGLKAYYDAQGMIQVPLKNNPTHFQLCYFIRPTIHPTLTFHFRGADFVVRSAYVTVLHLIVGAFCVALLPGLGGHSNLGAFHMQNIRIIQNGYNRSIQFYNTDCGADRF
ncbi:hypothetical protein Patl1_22587 [Pistacia atlantica]|uniref:Uncharacterized protein n=1 Tax=Pistacia atlantica TaxID=434234 RepID=A0ACC0ZZP4_9ROSI|nr:hypothetical protein Patl1_22587 [Pistacia atlantica]